MKYTERHYTEIAKQFKEPLGRRIDSPESIWFFHSGRLTLVDFHSKEDARQTRSPLLYAKQDYEFLDFFAFHPDKEIFLSINRCHLVKSTGPAPKEMTKPSKKSNSFIIIDILSQFFKFCFRSSSRKS